MIKLKYIRYSDTVSAKILQLWCLELLMVQVQLACKSLLSSKSVYSIDMLQLVTYIAKNYIVPAKSSKTRQT